MTLTARIRQLQQLNVTLRQQLEVAEHHLPVINEQIRNLSEIEVALGMALLGAVSTLVTRKALARERLEWLRTILLELDRAGLDHVSEVFDGDEPHRPGGTFAQAWNTGELLRARELCLEVLGTS